LIELFGELTKRLTDLIGTVKDPFLHTHEVLGLHRIIEGIDHVQIFLAQEPKRLEREEDPIHHLTGNITHGID
jgi:hypothetical protein